MQLFGGEPWSGMTTDNVFCRRHKALMSGAVQFSPANSSKLSTNLVVCLCDKPNGPLTFKQACMTQAP